MKVIRSRLLQIALRTLTKKEQRYVLTWIDRLKNWENDKFLQENSHRLDDNDNVYVLHTTSDFRLFLRLEADQITVMDVATKAAIMSLGGDSE